MAGEKSLNSAKMFFDNAKGYDNKSAKKSAVMQAYNTAIFAQKSGSKKAGKFIEEVERYAKANDIDLLF